MKALVAYYSETGNTEKVAQAIFEAISFAKELKKVQDMPTTLDYDVIFCGFPVHAHSVPKKAIEFIAGIPEGKKIAFFSTFGSVRGGKLSLQAFEHALGLAKKLKVLGHFGCRGKVNEKILDALMKNLEHKAWVEEARGASSHPDQNDLADAKEFAAQIIAKVKK